MVKAALPKINISYKLELQFRLKCSFQKVSFLTTLFLFLYSTSNEENGKDLEYENRNSCICLICVYV